MNAHAPCEKVSDGPKDSFIMNYSTFSIIFAKYHMKIQFWNKMQYVKRNTVLYGK
jgi:hypothetical protein